MTAPRFLYIPLCTPAPAGGCHEHGPACQSPGKRPLAADWASAGRPERDWDHNAGVLCGPDTGLLVIDVDTEEALNQYYSWALPDTFCVMSGRGWPGMHYYFRWPDGLERVPGRLDGVEIKGPGRQVVAWDSLHKSGKRYEKGGGTIAELPDWFVTRLREAVNQHTVSGVVDATPGAQRRLEALLAVLPDAEELRDGNWQATCPAHPDHDPSLVVTASENRVLVHCRAGCPAEAVVDAVGWTMPQLWGREPLPVKAAPAPLPRPGRRLLNQPSAVDEGQAREDWLVERLLTVDDVLHMPPIEWLVPGLLQVGATSQIVGPSTGGKSLWVLQTCIDLTLAGKTVVYCALEGKNGFSGRLRAQQKERGVEDLGRLFFYDLRVLLQHEETVEELRETVREIGADVVVLDTLVRAAPGVKENDAGEMQLLIEQAETVKYRADVAVWLVHHSGHGQERGRGSSAVPAAMDNTVFIFPVNGQDGKEGRDLVVKVFSDKIKDGRQTEPLLLKRHEHALGFLNDGTLWTSVVFRPAPASAAGDNLEARIQDMIEGGTTWKQGRLKISSARREEAKEIWQRLRDEGVRPLELDD